MAVAVHAQAGYGYVGITMRPLIWCLPMGFQRDRRALLHLLLSSAVSLLCLNVQAANANSYSSSLTQSLIDSSPHFTSFSSPVGSALQSAEPKSPLSSSESYSETAKGLLSLNACLSDAQCWGRGRRCIEGRCWGFAGPRRVAFECGVESLCSVGPIDGHFYGEGSTGSRGLFMLQAIRGDPWDCGLPRALAPPQQTACGDGDAQACELLAAGHHDQTSGHDARKEGETLSLGKAVRCTYTPGIAPQSSCTARLGLVPLELPVGLYTLCGCSSTDLEAKNKPCSSPIDFSVPIGTLKITGFEAPAVVPAAPPAAARAVTDSNGIGAAAAPAAAAADEPAGTAAAAATEEAAAATDPEANTLAGVVESDTIEETEPLQAIPAPNGQQQQLLVPRFVCTVGLPCELPSIKGVGLDSTRHFVRAFTGLHSSCLEAAKAGFLP